MVHQNYHLIIMIIIIKKLRGREETLGGDGYVYGINCGDVFMDVYVYANSSSCIH